MATTRRQPKFPRVAVAAATLSPVLVYLAIISVVPFATGFAIQSNSQRLLRRSFHTTPRPAFASSWTKLIQTRGGGESLPRNNNNRNNNLHSRLGRSMASEASTEKITTPPVARRDEDRVVWAGVAPEGWKADLPRQSSSSKEPLLDPPVGIPDPYGWMRDETRKSEDILNHLTAENAYTESMTAHLANLREKLYEEMLAAIQETDFTTPRPDGEYYYYTRTIKGLSYRQYCRAPRKVNDDAYVGRPLGSDWDKTAESPVLAAEEVILDVNQLAEGKSYCSPGAVKKSPSHKLLAYSADFTGGETCQMFVQDLATKEIVDHDPKLEISGSLVWGADDSTLFYMKLDEAHRPYRVYRRKVGQTEGEDELLFEELNDLFWMGIYKSRDGKYLFIEVSSKETTEIHYLDLSDSAATLKCIAKRREKVLYEIDHRNGRWWIHSNVGGLPNMALFTAPAVADCEDQWTLLKNQSDGSVLFEGGNDRSLDGVSCFQSHVLASGREGGLPRIWVIGFEESADEEPKVKSFERLAFEEDAYDVGLAAHFEFETESIVVVYDSLVTPAQSININLSDTTKRNVIKAKNVPNYDKELFGCERTFMTARDGKTQIPVCLVYRKDVMEQHKASAEPVPVHLYGYGSYGSCEEASFGTTRLSLLNRGIVYVIAHVRGGGEMGRQWYEEPNGAKYLCKKNTFNDFVDIARWLVDDRSLTTSEKLSCEGRSAGGLLIGASINQAPELFKAAVLGVPFVDVVPTMVDASIPLTAVEWEEWGNPNEVKYHQYMMEYSPVQNVKKAKYPSCLFTGGLHDPRVQYWEPAKMVAELRHSQDPQSGPVLLKIEMSSGHFSASDRYKYLKELAFQYAFLLDQLGVANE